MWSCFKVKSSPSWADGSEEEVFKKVTVANLAFYKKIADQIRHLRGAFEHSLVLGGGNLKEIISKVQMSGGILELIDA